MLGHPLREPLGRPHLRRVGTADRGVPDENCCSRMILPALTVIRVALDWASLASPVVVGKTTTTPSPSRSIRLGWVVVRACAAPA
jgi:hypothetical protein